MSALSYIIREAGHIFLQFGDEESMKQRVLQRTVTGIAGLDSILCGGLAANRMYLVDGTPGVGKTTLAMQFLLEGARNGERCLYVTLSETRGELEDVAESHGWSLEGI